MAAITLPLSVRNRQNCMVYYGLMSHSTQYRSFRRRRLWTVMCTSHSVMEGQRHNNPLDPRCFCLQRPKRYGTSGLGLDPGLDLETGLKTWSPRSQDSMLGAYACSMITVICSTFKRVLCHRLELMQPVLWSRDHGLETRAHSSSFCPGLGLETWWPKSRSWSLDLKKVLTTTLVKCLILLFEVR